MPNTQIPPEGTFYNHYREVETHDWYTQLSSQYRDALHAIVIQPDGWGICACSRGGKLYAGSWAGTDLCASKCYRCVRQILLNECDILMEIYRRETTLDYIMPHSQFPKHDTERIECDKCCGYVYEEGDYLVGTHGVKYVDAYVDNGTRTETKRVHKACAFKCECDYYFTAMYPTRLDSTAICSECFDRRQEQQDIHTCDRCDGLFTELTYSHIRDSDLCESCYNEEIECNSCGYCYMEEDDHECYRDSSGIYNYSYKPTPIFFGQADYHFGFELEVEDNSGFGCGAGASIVSDLLGSRVYMKSDGSLDDGFEIVSHPHSFEEAQRLDWSFLRELRNRGFRSWDTSTCGLHVHVSRTAFRNKGKRNEAHELRFQKLVYDNSAQVRSIAGRTSPFAKFDDKGKLVPKVKYGHTADRYEAINSQNDNTLEIRVFRGSLKKERVLSAIEFVHSAVEYTRDMKINPHDKQFSWIRFMAYVLDNQQKYPNFTQVALRTLDQQPVSSHIDEEN